MASSETTQTQTPREKVTRSGRISGLALLVASAFFMEFLDGTVIATALPDMAKAFGVSAIDLNIGISAYLLTLAMLIPASGWVAERFGARTVFSLALLIFTVASLLCGLTNNVTGFVLMRILQGVGGAMMVPVGRLVVLRTTPKEQLIKAIATLTWPALVAPIIGPPLGGFITTYASWHWIFFLNVPLGLVAIVLALKMMPGLSADEKRPFDVVGFIATGLTMLCLVAGLEMLSQQHVSMVSVGATLAVGLLALVWSIHHLRRTPAPLIGLSSLSVHSFRVTMRGGFILRATISSAPFMLPLMFQVGFGMSAFEAGSLVLAVFAGNLAMKPATTPLIRRFGFKKLLIGNGVVCVLSLFFCAFLAPNSPQMLTLALLFIGGLSRSMQFTGISSLAFAEVPAAEMSSANTLFSTSLQLANGLGVTLGALSIRAGALITDNLGYGDIQGMAFKLGFVMIALITAVGLYDMTRLEAGAGRNVSQKPKK
ncbi:MFS transporter [Phytobacter diazotrophicus]|uniref:MFS transporter n=1 Tax=Phytobacter diazotrophicus TaxID=395631 RepID=UPI0013E9E8F9|nr:MFS transporter [Phytobacter diazotrophicus]MDU4996974.1 MFS transporter [Enterobacteriaceae bacterium]MDU7134014.1 MFS transporter [Enterobacteriaceae bacterium]QIH64734.1 MFS transporter [Enterobacteriaceae bacterium A-F18]